MTSPCLTYFQPEFDIEFENRSRLIVKIKNNLKEREISYYDRNTLEVSIETDDMIPIPMLSFGYGGMDDYDINESEIIIKSFHNDEIEFI